ncbi:MAG: hypothetical protein Q8K23_10990 [Sulfuritalea sp.]|nr:hypothetical protein [Sulfuritalea sp.]
MLQINIEPIGIGPIYVCIATDKAPENPNMQTNVILSFLADSRRYLDS